MAAPALRQLSIGELLDVAIKIAWNRAAVLVPVVAVVVVPTQAVAVLLSISSEPRVTRTTDPVTGTESDQLHGAHIAAYLLALVLTAAAVALATGACFKAVQDAYLGSTPTIRSSLGYALRRFHSLLWVSLLAGVIPYIALFGLVIPGIWLWASLAVAVPAFMAEGLRGRRAIARSFRLVRGRWWPTFGALLVAFILTVVAESLLSVLAASVFLTDAGTTAQDIASGTGQIVAALLTTPFTASFLTVLYFDLRVRKEGYDLELRAQRMGEEDGQEPAW